MDLTPKQDAKLREAVAKGRASCGLGQGPRTGRALAAMGLVTTEFYSSLYIEPTDAGRAWVAEHPKP